MGATQSKSNEVKTDINAVNVLDILATKYILTQSFEDMQKLDKPEYCNKLIILTSDIIKKYLKEKDIKYHSQRVSDGVSSTKTASITFLSTNKLKKSANEPRKEYKKRVYNPDGTYREVVQQGVFESGRGRREKTLLTELDVQNKKEKEFMCIGIAKFYIKIAHLFAAILKSINPIYKYNGHTVGLMNKSKIPKGTNVRLVEASRCDRLIKTLTANTSNAGKIRVRVKNCELNRRTTTKQIHNDILKNINVNYGEEIVRNSTLGEEIGFKELEKLYFDVYNYTTGKFNEQSSSAKAEYKKDLKMFYKAFTGKSDYSKWNASGDKKFSDIRLIAYHDSKQCRDPNSAWRQSYEDSDTNPLFSKFAENISTMVKNSADSQTQILRILDELFVWVSSSSGTISGANKIVTINPKLNEQSLQKIVETTRKLLVKSYLQCETEYQTGLKLFEAIVGERILKNGIAQKKALEKQLQKIIVGDENTTIDKIVQNNINVALAQPHMMYPAPVVGGKRRKGLNKTKKKR